MRRTSLLRNHFPSFLRRNLKLKLMWCRSLYRDNMLCTLATSDFKFQNLLHWLYLREIHLLRFGQLQKPYTTFSTSSTSYWKRRTILQLCHQLYAVDISSPSHLSDTDFNIQILDLKQLTALILELSSCTFHFFLNVFIFTAEFITLFSSLSQVLPFNQDQQVIINSNSSSALQTPKNLLISTVHKFTLWPHIHQKAKHSAESHPISQ